MSSKKFEIISLTMRYWFIGLIIFITLRILMEAFRTRQEQDYEDEGPFGHIIFFMVIFLASAYALLAYKNPSGFDKYTALIGIIAGIAFIIQYNLFRLVFPRMDRLLLIIVDTLAIFGFIMLYRFNPDLAKSQMKYFIAGNVALLFFILFTYKIRMNEIFSYILMGLACVLLLLPIIFGKEIFGAKNWISIKGYSLQPSEFVKIILIFIFATWFREENKFREHLPAFIFAGVAILLVVLQRDLGAALLYFYIFIFVYYIATSDWIIVLLAGGAAVLGSVASYHLFSHIRVRVEAWKNPWRDIENKGYQIAHSLIAISSGGLIGTGLGLGSPQVVPAFKTDFIFATICEEFGIISGFCIIGLYAMIVIRGVSIALRNKDPYKALLAFGATVALTLQAFTIIGGVIKMIPLTGVTMPFVSYGGSSMVTSLALVGVLEGVAIDATDNSNEDGAEEDDYKEDQAFGEGV
ncbi:MAG: FtsW/RodA/SpoVE family cell cycle protein [Caldicoprobacterales bacterium]|nr:FtsW/RodA/SpoVE family cell cycle protein [Clostridiales bacterium]